MTTLWKMALAAGAAIIATHAAAQVSFFEREDFQGQAFTTDRPIQDMRSLGYSERIGSVVVAGGQWEFCDDAQFGGRCVVAVPGQYASLRALGLRGHVMSVRAVNRGPGVGDPHRPVTIRGFHAVPSWSEGFVPASRHETIGCSKPSGQPASSGRTASCIISGRAGRRAEHYGRQRRPI